MYWLTGVTMALLLHPIVPAAHQPCTYQACALAVSFQPFQLVRGEEREPLGRNLFGPKVQVLLDAGGEAADWAASYRRYHRAQQIMGVSALAAGATMYGVYHDDDQKLAVSLIAVGVVFGVLEEAFQLTSLSRLNRAVWWFNRQWAEGAP
jgi:hypothetical protein